MKKSKTIHVGMDIRKAYQEMLLADADYQALKLKRCRTCVHCKRYALSDYSTKVVQCCELKPSKRSNSGFKTIKVTDVACYYYEEREKK